MTQSVLSNHLKIKTMINSYSDSFTKAELKVANVVNERTEEILYFSVTELAEAASVADATVLRFCRKIRFKGYQDFKLALAQDLSAQKQFSAEEAGPDDYISHFFQNIHYTIEECKNLITKEVLDEAITLISEAKSLYFFGVGTSGITALDAKSRLMRIGKRADAISDPHFQSMLAATLTEKDVVIGLSVSGSTKDIIDSLTFAKNNGAKIIAITNYAKSPITKIADLVLLTSGKELPLEGGSIFAKMSQLFIIDLICIGLGIQDEENTKRMKEKTAKAVINKIL